MERWRFTGREKPSIPENTVKLTSYQIVQLFLFKGVANRNGHHIEPFVSLGVLSEEEKTHLKTAGRRLASEQKSVEIIPNLDGIVSLLSDIDYRRTAEILKEHSRILDIRIITSRDLSSSDEFSDLPLMAQYSFAQMGEGLYETTSDFLSQGGIIVFTQFEKPSREYREAIQNGGEGLIMEKITRALAKPNETVKAASHGFVSFVAVPPYSDPKLQTVAQNITKTIDRRINEKEEELAKITLLREILAKEMKGAKMAMIGTTVAIPLLYALNERYENNSFAQALIKFIPPFVADLVTFYSQLSPWLEGETKEQRMKDFLGKLTSSHRSSLILSLGFTAGGSWASEKVAENQGEVIGAYVYGAIPFLVAAATSYDTYRSIRRKFGKKPLETIRMLMKYNPAHSAIDLASAITFATAVGTLGYAGQFHNPAAIALIEGIEEHSLAALFTQLQLTFAHSFQFKKKIQEEVYGWLEEGFIPSH